MTRGHGSHTGFWTAAAALAFAASMGRLDAGEATPQFALGFRAPASVSGNPSSTVSFEAVGVLETTGLAEGEGGAQGWSVSISAEGAAISAMTTAGTVGADVAEGGLRNNGFEKSELTTGDGNEGAVSAVVLSFSLPITLPSSGSADIFKATVDASIPAEEGAKESCAVVYRNGNRGSGQPVDNKVTFEGRTVLPTLGRADVALQVEIDCSLPGVPLALVYQSSSTGQVEDLDASVISGDYDVSGSPGEVGQASIYVAIRSQENGTGVQGWSLGVGATDVNVTGATTDGTAGAETSGGGLRNGGFEKTEVIDPALDSQGQGTVSAVVLSFGLPVVLQPTGLATILRIDIESTQNVPEKGAASGSLVFRDGLRGSGQPVDTVATVNGITQSFCAPGQQVLAVHFVAVQVGAYRAGDANGDARLDIADPVFLINHLFRKGQAPGCHDAADSNADENLDLADASLVIQYLFFAGSAPTGSQVCAVDPSSTPESCPSGSTACDA